MALISIEYKDETIYDTTLPFNVDMRRFGIGAGIFVLGFMVIAIFVTKNTTSTFITKHEYLRKEYQKSNEIIECDSKNIVIFNSALEELVLTSNTTLLQYKADNVWYDDDISIPDVVDNMKLITKKE